MIWCTYGRVLGCWHLSREVWCACMLCVREKGWALLWVSEGYAKLGWVWLGGICLEMYCWTTGLKIDCVSRRQKKKKKITQGMLDLLTFCKYCLDISEIHGKLSWLQLCLNMVFKQKCLSVLWCFAVFCCGLWDFAVFSGCLWCFPVLKGTSILRTWVWAVLN